MVVCLNEIIRIQVSMLHFYLIQFKKCTVMCDEVGNFNSRLISGLTNYAMDIDDIGDSGFNEVHS